MKLWGIIFLFAASVWYGQSKITAQRRITRETEAFLHLIRHIREQINHFSRPLPHILVEYNNPYFDSTDLGESLRKLGTSAIEQAKLCLGDNAKTAVHTYFCRIGTVYREEALELSDYTADILTKALEEQKQGAKEREKMYRSIPLLLCASLALLLL